LDVLRLLSASAQVFPAWLLLVFLALPGTATAQTPGTGSPSQVRGAESVPTEIQREVTVTPVETNALARFLGIADSPVKIYGWLDNSYTYNANGRPRSDSNFSVFPNRLADSWQGDQYYVVIEKPARQGDTVDLGYRFDSFLGNDWEFSKDYGLFDRAFTPNSFAGVDLPQMFVEAHVPVLTNLGLLVRFGRFYSPAGFESVMATKRPLLSVPYLFNFTPFTFLGFQSILHVNPQLNLINSVVNGDDRWFNENYHYSYNGGFNWTSKNAATSVASYVLVGPGQLPRFPPLNSPFLPLGVPQSPPNLAGKPNHLYAHHPRTYFDITVTHKWNDRLTQAAETFFIIDTNVVLPTGRILREASWYGAANWFLYAFDSDQKYTGVWRAEIFEDSKGTATGVAGTYYEQTLGLIYKPKPWLWVRPEARYDWVQGARPFSDGTRSSQFTMAVDVILQF
jgi:hypothetical protein